MISTAGRPFLDVEAQTMSPCSQALAGALDLGRQASVELDRAISLLSENPALAEPKSVVCAICLDEFEDGQEYKAKGCEHQYHWECFRQHLASKIREGVVTELRCPEGRREVTRKEVRKVVPRDLAARFDRLVALRDLADDPYRRPARPC